MNDLIVITKQDLLILLKDSLELEALLDGGVRTWKNYDASLNEFRKQMWEKLKDNFDPELLESTKDITMSDLATIFSKDYIVKNYE